MILQAFLAFTFACIGISQAQDSDQDAFVQEQSQVVNPDGSYSYVWRTSNGINAEESGVGGVIAQGSYDFVSSDGVPVSIQYVADENVNNFRSSARDSRKALNLHFISFQGYRATGDLIPQPPAIPEYILRALEYIRNNPPPSRWNINLKFYFYMNNSKQTDKSTPKVSVSIS